jgi:hypothetical protein
VLEHLEHLEGGAVPVEAPGLVSRILRVELTMGYKEEEGALVGKDRLPSSHLLPLYYLLDVFI